MKFYIRLFTLFAISFFVYGCGNDAVKVDNKKVVPEVIKKIPDILRQA